MSAPLSGVRVIELATLFAGPIAATFLGDFGAEVTKIEHPRKADPARGHGPSKDGVGLWWKTIGRNKRTATIDLGTMAVQELLDALATASDAGAAMAVLADGRFADPAMVELARRTVALAGRPDFAAR